MLRVTFKDIIIKATNEGITMETITISVIIVNDTIMDLMENITMDLMEVTLMDALVSTIIVTLAIIKCDKFFIEGDHGFSTTTNGSLG